MSGDMMLWKDSWGFSSRIFDEMDKEFSEAEDMLTRMFRTIRESGRAPQLSEIPVLLWLSDHSRT